MFVFFFVLFFIATFVFPTHYALWFLCLYCLSFSACSCPFLPVTVVVSVCQLCLCLLPVSLCVSDSLRFVNHLCLSHNYRLYLSLSLSLLRPPPPPPLSLSDQLSVLYTLRFGTNARKNISLYGPLVPFFSFSGSISLPGSSASLV